MSTVCQSAPYERLAEQIRGFYSFLWVLLTFYSEAMVYYRLNGFQPPNIGYAPNGALQAPAQSLNGLTSPVTGLTSPPSVNGLTSPSPLGRLTSPAGLSLSALNGLTHAAANTGPGLLPPPAASPGTGPTAAAAATAAVLPHQQHLNSYLQKYVVSHLSAAQINFMVSARF